MKKGLVLASALLLAGCMTGSNYVNNIDSKGFEVPSNMKQGKACNYLGIFGTSTIKAAAENGNIKTIKYVDHSANLIRVCYSVYGY